MVLDDNTLDDDHFFHFLQEYGPEPLFKWSNFQEKIRSWCDTKNDPHAPDEERHAAKKNLLKIGQVLAGKKDRGALHTLSHDQQVRIIYEYEALLNKYIEELGNERQAKKHTIADLAAKYNRTEKTVRGWRKKSSALREAKEKLWKELGLPETFESRSCPSCGSIVEMHEFPKKRSIPCPNPDCNSRVYLSS